MLMFFVGVVTLVVTAIWAINPTIGALAIAMLSLIAFTGIRDSKRTRLVRKELLEFQKELDRRLRAVEKKESSVDKYYACLREELQKEFFVQTDALVERIEQLVEANDKLKVDLVLERKRRIPSDTLMPWEKEDLLLKDQRRTLADFD